MRFITGTDWRGQRSSESRGEGRARKRRELYTKTPCLREQGAWDRGKLWIRAVWVHLTVLHHPYCSCRHLTQQHQQIHVLCPSGSKHGRRGLIDTVGNKGKKLSSMHVTNIHAINNVPMQISPRLLTSSWILGPEVDLYINCQKHIN